MKRIMILLLLLVTAAFPAAVKGEETQGTEIPETADSRETEKPAVTLFDIRYYFEHRMLPKAFYQAPEETIASLLETGLYDRWSSYTAAHDYAAPYNAEAFDAREMMQDSGIRMLMLEMPQPENTLLCYRIYLCFDRDTGTSAYFTAEYSKYEGVFDECCLLCGWKPDGTHQYYSEGQILPDRSEPEYEKALAEEATAVLNLMREQIRADQPDTEAQEN